MNKKILIGSIIAVVLLTLVSFSSVVGFQSVKSDSKIASPLFRIKNNKGEISSNYIGKGKTINILLPRRNSKVELVEKCINIIKMMDDNTFDRFVDFIIKNHNKMIDSQELNEGEITKSLYHLRENPDVLKSSFLTEKETIIASNACSMACPPTFDDITVECLLFWIGAFIMAIIILITSFFTIGLLCQ